MDLVSRAGRLLELTQVLRRHRQPVSGAALADALGISLRTLYRDIASLQAQGARIDGARPELRAASRFLAAAAHVRRRGDRGRR